MPPRLIDQAEGANIALDKPILLLGRHHECDIQLNSRKISRRHCCIAQVESFLVIRDLNSTNGIRINGEKQLEGRLKPGDELTVGNFTFKIHWEGHPEQEMLPDEPIKTNSPAVAILEAMDDSDPNVSVEHPVPLSEPDGKASVVESQPEEEMAGSSASHNSHMEDQPPSIILPDNIRLAPSDDEFSGIHSDPGVTSE